MIFGGLDVFGVFNGEMFFVLFFCVRFFIGFFVRFAYVFEEQNTPREVWLWREGVTFRWSNPRKNPPFSAGRFTHRKHGKSGKIIDSKAVVGDIYNRFPGGKLHKKWDGFSFREDTVDGSEIRRSPPGMYETL